MVWKKIILIVLLSFSVQLRLFCDNAVGPLRQTIQPPSIESKSGYLTTSSDMEIAPELSRIFIAPQTRLPIMQDSSDSYLFLVKIDTCSVCCEIPKYQKYMVLMEPSKDRLSMYFRGGIEADIVPFALSAGEEMPITGSNDDNYFVSVKRRGFYATLKIPKDTQDIVFSRESAFAKLAAEQKRKGLEYFNGNWVPPAKAQELRNSQMEKENGKQRRWDALKSQAKSGVIVLKNGKVLHGAYKGGDKNSILFESNGDTRQYGIDDVSDIDSDKAISLGNLDSATQFVAQAKNLSEKSPGQAKRNLEQAQFFLRKINPSITELMGKTMDLGAQITKINDDIDTTLKKKNLVLYNFEVFPKEVLDYHFKNGHSLLPGKIWIEPSQLCKRCSGNGEIACAKCQATGKISKKCEKCQNGRIPCHICDGSGYKICSVCGGLGEFLRTCSRCGGSGVVSGYYSYPCGTNVYLSSGAVMIGTFNPWFYYPSYTTRTCPVCGGSGRTSVSCTYCGGIGKMLCPKTEKCNLCNGVGFIKVMCPDCEGRGKVTCPDCKGRGFSGEPQKAPGEDAKAPSPSNSAPAGGKSQTMMP